MDEKEKAEKRVKEKPVSVRYSSTNELDAKKAMKKIIEVHSSDENNVLYQEAL